MSLVRQYCQRGLRQFLLALYVLALAAPLAVQAGVQLEPTAIFKLDQDIAKSRCADNGGQQHDHHASGECCVLCAVPNLPDALDTANTLPFAFPEDRAPVITSQTIGLDLGLALRPPVPRGPPA